MRMHTFLNVGAINSTENFFAKKNMPNVYNIHAILLWDHQNVGRFSFPHFHWKCITLKVTNAVQSVTFHEKWV